MKVVITEPMPLIADELKVLEAHAHVDVLDSTGHDVILKGAEDADVLMVVYAKITSDIIENAKNLKGIIKYGVGVDNIDVQTATKLGIVVANVPDYAVETVADHAMGLMLTLSRRIMIADRMMRDKSLGSWASPPATLKGIDLRGKYLGLIGIGRIGKAVADRARGFGMKIIAFDPYISQESGNEMGVELMTLDQVFAKSDFISIHSPLTEETRGMINAKTISKMKDGVFIINTARGPLIDHTALVDALKSGKIGGAALDVLQTEPPKPDDPIFDFENVVLTPHIAYYTSEAIGRLEMSAVDHAVDMLQGKMPRNAVNGKEINRIKSSLP
ncbi:MAG: 2-hydroxyacid dehydrogenase [Nitrososphaerales archaeon]